MGKHERGYKRVERDFYPTPPWAVAALAEHVRLASKRIWECACGDGRMSEALKAAGAAVLSTDIVDLGYPGFDELFDFLSGDRPKTTCDGIVTNPAFGLRGKTAEAFIAAGLKYAADRGFLALLLPGDFDSAKTRSRFFAACPAFVGKIVLTRRVMWFEHPTNPTIQPKENSAWFLWERAGIQCRVPTLRYAPSWTQENAIA